MLQSIDCLLYERSLSLGSLTTSDVRGKVYRNEIGIQE